MTQKNLWKDLLFWQIIKAKHSKSHSLLFGHLILNTFMRDEEMSSLYGHSWHHEEHKLHSDWFACRISWIRLFTGRRPCKSLKLKEVISLDSPFDLLNLQLCSQSIWGKSNSVLHGIYLRNCWSLIFSIVNSFSVKIWVHWLIDIVLTFSGVSSYTHFMIEKKYSEAGNLDWGMLFHRGYDTGIGEDGEDCV